MIEEWYDIPGFENSYKINKNADVIGPRNKILKPSLHNSGYLKLTLRKNKKSVYVMVHQLLGLTFFEGYKLNNRKIVVDHIDNNKLNNKLENLQIISFRKNVSKDRVNTTSKYTGVSKNKINNKYLVYIDTTGKSRYIGSFTNEIDAANAYNNELNKYLNNAGVTNN